MRQPAVTFPERSRPRLRGMGRMRPARRLRPALLGVLALILILYSLSAIGIGKPADGLSLFALAVAALGLIIARRQPGNRVAWLLLGLSVVLAFYEDAADYADPGLPLPPRDAAARPGGRSGRLGAVEHAVPDATAGHPALPGRAAAVPMAAGPLGVPGRLCAVHRHSAGRWRVGGQHRPDRGERQGTAGKPTWGARGSRWPCSSSSLPRYRCSGCRSCCVRCSAGGGPRGSAAPSSSG